MSSNRRRPPLQAKISDNMCNKTGTPQNDKHSRRMDIAFLLNPEESPLEGPRTNFPVSNYAGSSGLSQTLLNTALPESNKQQPSARTATENQGNPVNVTADNGNSTSILSSQANFQGTGSSQSSAPSETRSGTDVTDVDKTQSNSPKQSRMALKKPLKSNHPATSQEVTNNIPCDECGVCFCNEQAVTRHKRVQHPSEDPKSPFVQCPICKQTLRNAQNLTRHIRTHGPAAEFECKQCQVRFSTRRSRFIHMRDAHGRKANQRSKAKVSFLCPYGCGYASKLSNVKRHYKNLHMGIKKFRCACGYRGSTKANLEAHMDTHGEC